MRRILIFFFFLFHSTINAQIYFTNPGFEDTPHGNTPPVGWDSCGATPDCMQGDATFLYAFQGQTYLGLQCDLNWSEPYAEASGQYLNCNMVKGKTHHFLLYCYQLSYIRLPFLSPGGRLQFWGGFNKCDLDSLLWQSPVLDTSWQQYSVSFIPSKSYTYMTFIANNITNDHSYLGVDDLSEIKVDNYNFLSTSFTDTTITADSCIILKAISDDTTATYQWNSLPSGFSETGSSITDCPSHNTKYVCTATYGCGSQKTDTVNVNVVPNEVESIMFNGSLFIFPNPVNDKINIEILNDILPNEIKVVDVMGKVWKQFKPIQSTLQIDIINLPQGIYFVQIKSENRVQISKIVKE